ncbi:PLP-dependent aminotransferase family protein [Mycolicibacterium sp. CBMA 226]|uniref:MocR-like pyridoxine biosynthesis transcription factor PdxR n=1 Tax=Mycolicibacterium sp. CBMA 226 TaxID=2606611 RepID=UPI00130B744C|nr:PLP-dependent aminotransferase family protein [Mycolicibacterium sp. CBMA 226]MUL77253.1 PLP-dependent aminotransferase family protein [Mycolicibacterium sp. CBMA 226]
MSWSNSEASEQTNRDGFPADILVNLDRSIRTGLAVQLQHQLRVAIQQGRLTAGTTLPPSRILAQQLGVSRSVVVTAYEHLTADGYLAGRQGSGTQVQHLGTSVLPAPTTEIAGHAVRLIGGLPDPALFPRAEWLRHYRAAVNDIPNNALTYPGPLGAMALRQALADYLARVRGVAASPENIQVTTGITQAVALVARALKARGGRAIALEDPCFAFHRDTITNAGLTAVPVPVDHDGINVDHLAGLDVDAVLVAPAHSYPTGVVLSPDRRTALVDWARRRKTLIVEDDYDAEFRYDRQPIGALQGLAPELIAYAGCASKTLTPALRLGWIALPQWLIDDVTRQKLYDDMGNTLLEQLAFARFMAGGGMARHLRRVRPTYRRRRDALLAALTVSFPDATPMGVSAGLHLHVQLPDHCDEDAIVDAAYRRGVHVGGARWYWADPSTAPPALVIGYGSVSESDIGQAIAVLGSLAHVR